MLLLRNAIVIGLLSLGLSVSPYKNKKQDKNRYPAHCMPERAATARSKVIQSLKEFARSHLRAREYNMHVISYTTIAALPQKFHKTAGEALCTDTVQMCKYERSAAQYYVRG